MSSSRSRCLVVLAQAGLHEVLHLLPEIGGEMGLQGLAMGHSLRLFFLYLLVLPLHSLDEPHL